MSAVCEKAAGAAAAVPAPGASDALALEALLVSRAYLYALFHKLFGGEPNAELLAELTCGNAADAVDEYADASATLAGLAAFLRERAGHDAVELLDAAKDEYTRLFIGPAALPGWPWEAPYVSGDAAAFQERTLAVRAAYARHGWQPKRLMRVPDDHVALMCDFMARLSEEALAAFHAGSADSFARRMAEQGEFARDHLANWTPEWAKRLRASRTAALYPQLAEGFAAFAQADAVCAAEAAAWAQDAASLCGAADEAVRRAFSRIEEATRALRGLRLFGIEENELADAAPAARGGLA